MTYNYCQTSNIKHHSRQRNCWSLRCSWSIVCRRCSNYIFILDSDETRNIEVLGFGVAYIRGLMVCSHTLTLTVSEISCSPLPVTSVTMGVMRPLSVATATQMSTLLSSRAASPAHMAFTSGTLCNSYPNNYSRYLTNWGMNKMVAILHTTFSKERKVCYFDSNFT